MSVTVNWPTKVISIPKAYLTLDTMSPYEIRTLNSNQFHLDLRALEISEQGIIFDATHNHTTIVTLGGTTFARLVEIINDYTITFEDGSYAVAIVGANTNFADVLNLNTVSVRTANTAGLIETAGGGTGDPDAIWDEQLSGHSTPGSAGETLQKLTYNGTVVLDTVDGTSGTTFPIGTKSHPVDNWTDAKTIMENNGLSIVHLHSDITVEATDNVNGYSFESPHVDVLVTLTSGCTTQGTSFSQVNITGNADGKVWIDKCGVYDYTGFEGYVSDSVLAGDIVFAATATNNSWFECLTAGQPDTLLQVDINGGKLNCKKFSGQMNLKGKTGSDVTHIEFITGQIKIDSTCTNGIITLKGIGRLVEDNSGEGCEVHTYDLVGLQTIADAVWDELLSEHGIDGSTGEALYIAGKMAPDGGWMSSSTAAEIKLVRDKLGDAGNLIAETIIDEEAITTNADTVFTMYQMIYEVNGVWLLTDTDHTGTNYYVGDNGAFDSHTGMITLHTSLPSDNEEVLISYTYFKGLHDDVITQFLTEAKMYVKKYTRKDYTWSQAFDDPPDEETQIALWAAAALAGKRCLEALAAGDILQLGFNFRLGDLEIENMVRGGGFQVQAHIDMLNEDVNNKLAMLGRGMYFSAKTTKRYGRDFWGYSRSGVSGRRRSDVQ